MGANDWGVYIESGVAGWQIVEPAPVPLDMTRNMPMLGFYGLKVRRSR